ncbi:MAG TPA: hydroxymethylglutaryl-CoA lyase [Caulobacteraceae bacterium]|nr:hydroxymethylglutaryl-CoA lyase [Caulobacteraceae bacterium]
MTDAPQIVEVSPRDGLQNEKVLVSTRDKVELVYRAAAAGARRIEAVSFVNPKAVPQMADAEAVMARLREDPDLRARGVSLAGLIVNRRGVDRALAADVDELNFVVVASETFNRRNQGAAIAETLEQVGQAAAIARTESIPLTVTIGAAFGCPFEGEVPPAQVAAIARELRGLGVAEIALADTIGVGDPVSVETRVAAVREAAPGVPLRCHFHNTRNTGIANALAAWRAGVGRLDASIGGIGGCPFAPAATGNIPTEDTAYMFERMGLSTGYDLAILVEAAQWLGERLGGGALPGMLSRAGLFPPAAPAA